MNRPVPQSDAEVQRALDARVWAHDGLTLRRGPLGLELITTRPFAAGEVIYRAAIFMLSDDEHWFTARTLVDDRVEVVDLTPEHTVRFHGARWLDIPGCFANHACEPRSASMYLDPEGLGYPTAYDQVALVDLAPGDAMTCDYTRFDWGDDGLAFTCACGAADCYGWIDGFGGLPPEVQERTSGDLSMEAARRWALRTGD